MNALDHVFGDRALNVSPDPQAERFGVPCPCCGVEMHGGSCPACTDDRCDTVTLTEVGFRTATGTTGTRR